MSSTPPTYIQRIDPRFNDFPDFKLLREKGIEYISQLSGDIWTDYNLHDPGITILEVLCYALTDLGYRTSLDEADLLAPAKGQEEDNFLTPEQILTNSPISLLDYRKMLVDIPGVRNAWIQPSSEQEQELYFDLPQRVANEPHGFLSEEEKKRAKDPHQLTLSGLYQVYIEVDPILSFATGQTRKGNGSLDQTLKEVKRRLHAHRNLCEDFFEIILLQDEEIGLCLELDLLPKANPDEVLGEVYERLERFISPRLPFYSLGDSLKRGRSMESLFRGRPNLANYFCEYADALSVSHGFVDEEELRRIELPTVLRASDLYREILEVKEVRAIKELKLVNYLDGIAQTPGEDWELNLSPGHRPLFSPEKSVIRVIKNQLQIPISLTEINRRFRRRLADYRKIVLDAKLLDGKIPYQRHRKDLAEYHSIQEEFPTVYGIGNGDLDPKESPLRKTQALQLQGFLSFFDQLLANYLGQLANIRKVFSWSNKVEASYFGQEVQSSPAADQLLRFQRTKLSNRLFKVLATSAVAFDHPTDRDQQIGRLAQEFRQLSLQQWRERTKVSEQGDGKSFTFEIKNQKGQVLLRSEQNFSSRERAEVEAESTLIQLRFQGGVAANYEKENNPAEHHYSFRIVDNPASYNDFLQTTTEAPEQFAQRRNRLLDHLLARFGEDFTSYALLMYALNQQAIDPKTIIEDKQRFLQDYPRIGHDRSQGYDYTHREELWNSAKNLSGLEQRLSRLMGLDDWSRRKLNNWNVRLLHQKQFTSWRDHRGQLIWKTAAAYPFEKKEDCKDWMQTIWQRLAKREAYLTRNNSSDSIYGIYVTDEDKGLPLLEFPESYPTAAVRDQALECILAYFHEPYGLELQLLQDKQGSGYQFAFYGSTADSEEEKNQLFWCSQETYPAKAKARVVGRKFLAAARRQKLSFKRSPSSQKKGYGLSVEAQVDGVTIRALAPQLFSERPKREEFLEQRKAYHKALLPQPAGMRIALDASPQGYYFQLLDEDGSEVFWQSVQAVQDRATACSLGLEMLAEVRRSERYLPTQLGDQYGLQLLNAKGQIIGQHPKRYGLSTERDSVQETILEFYATHHLEYQLRQDPASFYWLFQAGENGPQLRSSFNFSTAEEAEANWAYGEAFMLQGRWQVVEDEFSGYIVQLIRQDQLVIAVSGGYRTADDAHAAITLLNNHWDKPDSPPTPTIKEQMGKWFFELYVEGEQMLVGKQRYPKQHAAACAFLDFRAYAKEASNYQIQVDPDGCYQSFAVVVDEEVLAYYPKYLAADTAKRLQDRVIAEVANNYFITKVNFQAFNWQYRVQWEDCWGHCADLLQSQGDGWPDPIAAKQAALDMVLNIKAGKDLANSNQDEVYGFAWLGPDNAYAIHPQQYDSAEERDWLKQDAVEYFKAYHELIDDPDTAIEWEDAHYVHCESTSACPCDEEEPKSLAGKDSILSRYELREDDKVLASYPGFFRTATERNQLIKDIQEAKLCGHLQYRALSFSLPQVETAPKKLHPAIVAVEGRTETAAPHRYRYEWCSGDDTLWRSVESFPTPEAALAARQADFPRLLELSAAVDAYQSLSLEEHLRQLAKNCWPNDKAAAQSFLFALPTQGEQLVLVKDDFPLLYVPDLDSSEGPNFHAGRQERLRFVARYPFRWQSAKGWSYRLYQPGTDIVWLESQAFFPTHLEAIRAYDLLLELLSEPTNYRKREKTAARIFKLEIVETLLIGHTIYADDAKEYKGGNLLTICPAEYQEPVYKVEGQAFPVADNCNPQDTMEELCPRAWEEGLDQFHIYGTESANYYHFVDPQREGRLGFRIAKPDYRLARNPQESHTPREREQLLKWLFHYSNCNLKKETLQSPYHFRVNPFGEGYRLELIDQDSGAIQWYSLVQSSEAAFFEQQEYLRKSKISWLNYLQEADYYQPTRVIGADGELRYRLQLLDQQGVPVLESMATYVPGELGEVVTDFIQKARKYPFYLYEGRYGFQCFSHQSLPNFRSSADEEEVTKVVSHSLATSSINCGPTSGLEIQLELSGEVIWESVQEYDSLEEAEQAFRCFCKLLADGANYQRVQLQDCNLFGLELTRPDQILAEHPRCYSGKNGLEVAIERTRKAINNEGFHLIEHLLLRPRTEEDETIPNICPQPLPEEVAQPSTCSNRDQWVTQQVEETTAIQTEPDVVQPYVAGADPYSFWATVVLPYWPQRFQNANFRQFFEASLRREAPAHVALRICWLDPKQLRELERRYRAWMYTLSEVDECGRSSAQNALVRYLFSITSVFPPASLQGDQCAGGLTEAGAVLLNNTQLS